MRVRLVILTIGLLTFSNAMAEREIIPVRDGLFQFRDDRHYSIFLVTEHSILVTDPQNRAAANWLKKELDRRFSKPVRYVVYSHNHSDHVYGGEVFANENTQFIGHELARQDLHITGAETPLPDITFNDRLTLHVDDTPVELRYHGPNDGRGSISFYFPEQQVAHVVDWIVLDRMPWQKLWSYDIHGMINSALELEKLEWDLISTGHSRYGPRSKAITHRQYLQDLRAGVIEGINKGISLEQIQQSIHLDQYSHLAHHDEWLDDNIEGVYEHLSDRSGLGWRPLPVR